LVNHSLEIKTMFTLTTPASLTKPYDIAFSAVVQATEYAKAAYESGVPSPATFQFRHLICNVFTTPKGQTRYQVGICGKPQRTSDAMVQAMTCAETEAQAYAARGTRVPMVAEVNYCEGHAPTVMLKGRVLLALETGRGYRHYFHVGAMPRGQFGRKDYAGEMVEGPWAFANGRAVCLSASEAIRERDAAEEAAAIVVKDGTRLLIDNCSYRVEVIRGEWLKLHLEEKHS
jgi:hypothetical protein